jgi:D-aminopeptidase
MLHGFHGLAIKSSSPNDMKVVRNDSLDPIFSFMQATEEAIVNAMIAAEIMTGIENRKVMALPHDQLRAVLKKCNR